SIIDHPADRQIKEAIPLAVSRASRNSRGSLSSKAREFQAKARYSTRSRPAALALYTASSANLMRRSATATRSGVGFSQQVTPSDIDVGTLMPLSLATRSADMRARMRSAISVASSRPQLGSISANSSPP